MALSLQFVRVLIHACRLALSRVLFAGALAVSLAAQVTAAPPPGPKGPVIKFASPVYDFGTALAGDLVEHVFVFTNAGDAPLEILGVYPSCNCTVPGGWTNRVAPGEVGSVELLLDTSRFQGPIAESTVVASNDRAHFNVALRFKGTVHQPIEVLPRAVLLRPNSAGASNAVRIVSYLPETLTLQQPVSEDTLFVPRVKVQVPGREFQLAVSSSAHPGSLRQSRITIRTSSTRVPIITIPVLLAPPLAPVDPSGPTSKPRLGRGPDGAGLDSTRR